MGIRGRRGTREQLPITNSHYPLPILPVYLLNVQSQQHESRKSFRINALGVRVRVG
ncbi:hypothetical protein [Chroococcidiopsis thermalis]|uniref:hypothetical protein n=1 Tax=Chroococcidiopsis thermalis TaxID=54299 RepID=UPI0002E9AA95|nr:hypothetical protein [Chroococcidiopsis thermalis]